MPSTILKRLNAFYHPERFQGWGKTKRYFEGWYYKLISADEKTKIALIPGIAFDESGEGHAFIQLLDGVAKTAEYYKFGSHEFKPSADTLHVTIDKNAFSDEGLSVDLPDCKGDIAFDGNTPWPSSWNSPGIMGPYAYAPFMECYHGIVSLDHGLSGKLNFQGREVDFNGGRGYCEKDWGRSFPSAYVWMQSNHFSNAGVSLKASVARIPWLTGDFTGFIAGFWDGESLYQFTTYNGTKLMKHEVSDEEVLLELQNRRHRLSIRAAREDATILASPIQGAMDGRISESMNATLHVELVDNKNSETIFKGSGRHAGLEVAGAIDLITI